MVPEVPRSRKEAELHQAWDLYYHVFKRINKQLPSLTVLELQYVAPALVRAQVRSPAVFTERTLKPSNQMLPPLTALELQFIAPALVRAQAHVPAVPTVRTLNPMKQRLLCSSAPRRTSQRRSFWPVVRAQPPAPVCACLTIPKQGMQNAHVVCFWHCMHLVLMFCGHTCLL